MALYKVCDLVLNSSIPLPELPRVEDSPPDYTFRLLSSPAPRFMKPDWFHHWTLSDGETWLAFARVGTDYLLRFPELVDFLVSVTEKEIRCHPNTDTPLETVRHLLLDQVIPLVLSRQGKLVLHASAVAAPQGAIAFLGETGRGKSTLAAAFSRQGFPLLTDDCLLIEERGGHLLAKPSYSGVRLWPDSISALFDNEAELSEVAHYTTKKRLQGQRNKIPFCDQPVPLKRVLMLGAVEDASDTRAISISPIAPRDAFMEIVKYSFHMDIGDHDRLREEFDLFTRIAALPLFYRLTFPRDLSLLPVVQKAILENLSE